MVFGNFCLPQSGTLWYLDLFNFSGDNTSAKSTLKRILRKNKVCLCEREGYGGGGNMATRGDEKGLAAASEFHGESKSTGCGHHQAEPDEERKT